MAGQLSGWHHGTMRDSLIRLFYYASQRQMMNTTRNKANRKIGVQSTFRKQLIKDYDFWDQDKSNSPTKGPVWNICNGAWEPERQRRNMTAAHIVPQMLGKPLFKRVFGDNHIFPMLYGSQNALLLPKGVGAAFDDWAITIVPDMPENATIEQQTKWAASDTKEFKFRVIDPEHEALLEPITRIPKEDAKLQVGKGLHGQPLLFRETSSLRPSTKYLYFQHCCAIMHKYHDLFYDDAPLDLLEVGNARRSTLEKATLREMRYLDSPLLPRGRFWRRMIWDMRFESDNGEPDYSSLNWSMELTKDRYSLVGEEEGAKDVPSRGRILEWRAKQSLPRGDF